MYNVCLIILSQVAKRRVQHGKFKKIAMRNSSSLTTLKTYSHFQIKTQCNTLHNTLHGTINRIIKTMCKDK